MNRISMERPGFGEDKIIERIEATGLRYNTKISKPETAKGFCDGKKELFFFKGYFHSVEILSFIYNRV